jgi:hypothetical protein
MMHYLVLNLTGKIIIRHLIWLNKYIDAADAVSSDEARKQMNFVNAKYKARERAFEIEKLETEKKIQMQQFREEMRLVLALSGILLISLIAGF